jgi:hypothetical protein
MIDPWLILFYNEVAMLSSSSRDFSTTGAGLRILIAATSGSIAASLRVILLVSLSLKATSFGSAALAMVLLTAPAFFLESREC